MEVKRLNAAEYEQFRKIGAGSYLWNYEPRPEREDYNEIHFGTYCDGKLAAGLAVLEFSLYFFGKKLNALGIGGVATLPEYRRRGAVRAMFVAVEDYAEENDISLGFLYPFSVKYYEKFGYGLGHRYARVVIPLSELSFFNHPEGVRLYEGENDEEIVDFYNRMCAEEELMPLHHSADFISSRPFEGTDFTYITRNPSGKISGLLRFTRGGDEIIKVLQMLFDDKDALYSLLGFLRTFDGVASKAVIDTISPDSPILTAVNGLKCNISLYNGPSCRIYDPVKVLSANAGGSFSLRLEDVVSKRTGIYTVDGENVSFAKEGEWDLCLSSVAAARLIVGGEGFDARSASFIDGVKFNNPAQGFFRAYPKHLTNFPDSF